MTNEKSRRPNQISFEDFVVDDMKKTTRSRVQPKKVSWVVLSKSGGVRRITAKSIKTVTKAAIEKMITGVEKRAAKEQTQKDKAARAEKKRKEVWLETDSGWRVMLEGRQRKKYARSGVERLLRERWKGNWRSNLGELHRILEKTIEWKTGTTGQFELTTSDTCKVWFDGSVESVGTLVNERIMWSNGDKWTRADSLQPSSSFRQQLHQRTPATGQAAYPTLTPPFSSLQLNVSAQIQDSSEWGLRPIDLPTAAQSDCDTRGNNAHHTVNQILIRAKRIRMQFNSRQLFMRFGSQKVQ